MVNVANSVKRVLFVSSEIFPYLPETQLSKIARFLPQGVQERGREIRSFMPRYGCINERKNQLHEVIRLSGMNIVVDDVDRPLIIKVASISAARIQVYFIDNEDYFKRKQLVRSEDGTFFEDNAQRAVFFARGVLETVKKLRWAPDIIHCHGWISHLVPVFLKAYRDDPIFSGSKVVLSLYEDVTDESFSDDLGKLLRFGSLGDVSGDLLAQPNGINLAKFAASRSDGIILASPNVNEDIVKYCRSLSVPVLGYNAESIENGSYIDEYNGFYDKL